MISNKKTIDFLVVGAGIIGLNIALSLKKQFPESKILIIEKEEKLEMDFKYEGDDKSFHVLNAV